jgi:transcriptional regulator with XRE-family HTH domain
MTREGRDSSREVAVKFGRNLSRCREKAGFSQDTLASRASLHRTAVSMIERGERLARVDTMLRLAAALSISPMDLTEGIEWYPGRPASQGGFVIRDIICER